MKWIKKLLDNIFPHNRRLSGQHIDLKKITVEFNARRLQRVMDETGHTAEKLQNLAAFFEISLVELVDYYSYFGRLPSEDHINIIRHFGVQNLISEVTNKMAALPVNKE